MGHGEWGAAFGGSRHRAAFIVGGDVTAWEMLERRHGFCLGIDTVPVWD